MKCSACGFLNHDSVRFCNSCGRALNAPSWQNKIGSTTWKWVLGIVLLFGGAGLWALALSVLSSKSNQTLPPQSTTLPSSSSQASRPAAAVSAAPPRTAWQYDESEDKMTGQKTKTAVVTSSNTVDFAFPYGGEQHATLILRGQRGSDNVILTIEKGQTCGDYFGRSVSVRFDEKPARRFNVTEPADHSSTKVFINNEKSFIAEAKKSKRIRIEAIVYQNGSPVFEFNTAGLE